MSNAKEKVSMVSLGCPKNLVDAEVMLGRLAKDRYEITTDEREADIIIVNTCSFIKEAKQESIDTILDLADRKQDGRCRLLIVTGCLPQRYQEELARELPEVDIFVGTGDYPRIAEIIEEKSSRPEQLRYIGDPNFVFDESLTRLNSSPAYTAYLKIAEGCSNCCSYCVIPSLRGAFRSRPLESVLAEARSLVAGGAREINLIAQDITTYGRDLPGAPSLETLIRELAAIDGLAWIRLLYAYPDGITDGLIQTIKNEPKVCKYLDLPIQHISDPILKRMNRRSTEPQIRELVARLREEIPDIALRTSLIVGFPGETEEDFRTLLHFVEEAQFDRLGVFCYSREEGTPAAEMPDQVSERVKRERYKKLMKAQARVSFKRNRRLIDTEEQVIVEGYSEETELLLKGRSSRQAPDIDGQVYITAGNANVGDIVRLRITDSSDYDLIGEIIS
ncbi:30S ribosomal protein S12 methylthiotransferase RimO [Geobacter sulfurreducens]|uniref:Ribosomal protein uS12 methylthiotransferase RimO n=1 Tax=Geobacter sulfurreducens (strain ATCC 51573 / DSM 12127 / PCA) TaxID=243231 RepID=RIMO_GEOSL|nr:30S ribosomal protein S12 methylthiotransferase RimO [Geobacter sulfurreducens]Q747R0.1 RecName: Full=Ribosomal protein uS12 methylthiotransferase RimO; Short=uS12 MTTase; Short=uS12 methylthiotransferase; AltName: Full=Ribosomal protein uS12 (aspartate-C(3))-methylthiotransferase; AltName: Full=Ribosome maturation factor RimO [Geobacter sulfurreducens PCA]AAR36596.1 ribosomal protein S12 methylthiotransferase [Geobacter sulfurreducens PCA]ADI85954.1 ribosomal protein S12 methylthiotransferas